MNSRELETKYSEVSPFDTIEGHCDDNNKQPVKKIPVFMAAIAGNVSAFASGTCLGWTSPVGPKLKAQDTSDSPLSQPINPSEDAWIGSVIALGAFLGPFVSGPLSDKIGRKWVLLSSSIFFIVSFGLMLVADKVWIMLVGRALQGVGTGFVTPILPMYVCEIATDDVRGAVGSLMQLFLSGGVLYVYAIGPYVSYNVLQYFCLAVPIVFVAVFLFMPESPYYYAGKGQRKHALQSLQFLRGQSLGAVQAEMVQIEASIEAEISNKGTLIDILKTPGNRKGLLLSMGLMAFQHLSGINAVSFNSQSIFESANIGLNAALSAIIIGVVQVVSSGLTPTVIDRLGRKALLLTSASVMGVCLIGLGAFFYAKIVVGDASHVSWLPLPVLIVYNIAYFTGFGPVPWVLFSEMLTKNVRATGTIVVSSTAMATGFFVIFFYPILNALGSYHMFWLFAVFCVVAFFFILLFVMETKGLSLLEIQNRLIGRTP